MSVTTAALGMNAETGASLTGLDHIQQSIQRILSTPVGSCIARRSFGSDLPFMIDQPLNTATRLRVVNSVATAIRNWEPRVTVQALYLTQPTDAPGTLQVELNATVIATQQPFNQSFSISKAST